MEYSVYVVLDDDGNVQDMAYLDKKKAEDRVAHLAKEGWFNYVAVVKVWIDPPAPQYVPMPYPVMPTLPPSAVHTPDYDTSRQGPYDAPRRVFRQPSLENVLSGAWTSWASQQAAQGNFESASEGMTEAARLFEVSPEGRLQLYPRDLPVPAH